MCARMRVCMCVIIQHDHFTADHGQADVQEGMCVGVCMDVFVHVSE